MFHSCVNEIQLIEKINFSNVVIADGEEKQTTFSLDHQVHKELSLQLCQHHENLQALEAVIEEFETVKALSTVFSCCRYCCQNASNGNRKYRMLPTAGQRMPNRNLAAFFQRDGYSKTRQKVRWSVKNEVWEK